MRHHIAFASLGLVAIATIAAACAGFSSEETPGVPDSGMPDTGAVIADTGSPVDTGSVSDTGVVDAAEATWGDASLLRPWELGTTTLRPGAAGANDFYLSTQLGGLSGPTPTIQYLASIDRDASDVASEAGVPLKGSAPSPGLLPFQSGFLPMLLLERDGDLFLAFVNKETSSGELRVLQEAGVAAPYVPSIGVCYFGANGKGLFRSHSTTNDTVEVAKVSILSREVMPDVSTFRNPVVTRTESRIFFAAGGIGDPSMWTATRSANTGEYTFENATRFAPNKDQSDFPTAWQSSDAGETLYFTRIADGGSEVFTVTKQ